MQADTVEQAVTGDAVAVEFAAMVSRLGELARDPAPGADAARIDRIALLERLRGAVAAAQHAEQVAFARSQAAAQILDDRVDPRMVGRGIADQIALARHISPVTGSRQLETGRALQAELPQTYQLLATGRISERVAELIVSQTRHLHPPQRVVVDKQLAEAGLDELSPARAEALVKKLAYATDPAAYLARGRTAREDRRVGLRPAPDTMSVLTGFLPVEQGVACLAALRRRTDELLAAGDPRTRAQLMADTLVERLTGQVLATDVNVEIGIVIPVDALLDPDTGAAAEITGHGPIPAGIAADILAASAGRRFWRRLFTRPHHGMLIGGDPRRRRFDGVLAHLIRIRDAGRCRDPYCDAPIRDLDHIHPHRAGGPTSYVNGRGTCTRGNLVREMPGWQVELVSDGLGAQPHTVRTTTPTGHSYTSRAGP